MRPIAIVDIGDAVRGLISMGRVSLRPAFQAIKPAMKADQVDHRKAKSGPDSRWAPRSAATIAQNKHRKHARSLLGRLPTAVAYKVTPRSVTATSRAKFAEAHMEGAVVGHGARLHARQFLWISDKLLDFAADVVSRVVVGAFGPLRRFGGR